MRKIKIILLVNMFALLSACSPANVQNNTENCKNYQFGLNVVHCRISGCTYSSEPIIGEINETGSIVTVTNLEEVDIELSYIPATDATLAVQGVTIEEGASIADFSGLEAKGHFEIVRVNGMFKGREDGADIAVCFDSAE